MAELSKTEIRKTIATSLGTAFGIVIGMIWTQVVLAAFAAGGIPLTAGGTWTQWGYFVVTASVVTLICVVAIIMLGRWGGKQ
jgi:hypothetical protein